MTPLEGRGRVSFGTFKLENVPTPVLILLVCLCAGVAAWFVYLRVTYNPEVQLVSLREAQAVLQASVNEYNTHIAEAPETSVMLMDDIRGKLWAQRYGDGCIVIARSRNGRVRSKLILDLERDDNEKKHTHWGLPVVEARGRCLNPHYGQFTSWYGERRGDWIQVYRQWPDRCQHFQWYDAPHNYWDSNPDGTPKVTWTNCSH